MTGKKNKSFIADSVRDGVKKALCEWELIETALMENQPVSLVRILLHTGRTHQIRVQFGSRHFPIVGDGKYGSRIKAGAPALWAFRISFPHPCMKDKIVCTSSMPPSVFPWELFHLPEAE